MPSFEDQMIALEAIVARLEVGELALEESLQLFEEGMRLTSACRSELDAAEGRLQVLSKRRGGGMVPVELTVDDDEEDEEN